jgi:hypothetical protein
MNSHDEQSRSDSAQRPFARQLSWKSFSIAFGSVIAMAFVAIGWRHFHSRLESIPPARSLRATQPVAKLASDSSRMPANQDSTEAQSPAAQPHAQSQPAEISIHPIDEFREELNKILVQQLAPTYPAMPELNMESPKSLDPAYRSSVFQFLEAAETAPDTQRPAMLLAADFMLQSMSCPSEEKDLCDEVRNQFTEHKLTFAYSELAAQSFYQHDLLWRVWQQYATNTWGERAFVLLLDSGWDTSNSCAKGADQFREVIRQGKSFLQQHPDSPYRAFVVHLIGQAYATWWTLSTTPSDAMGDYVDPKLYTEGSEQARLKAVSSFEQVQQLAGGTPLDKYAHQILPALREQRPIGVDGYRFFCIYD